MEALYCITNSYNSDFPRATDLEVICGYFDFRQPPGAVCRPPDGEPCTQYRLKYFKNRTSEYDGSARTALLTPSVTGCPLNETKYLPAILSRGSVPHLHHKLQTAIYYPSVFTLQCHG